jgi:uncharacterized protein involved in exopolysaccharide biosynthesis
VNNTAKCTPPAEDEELLPAAARARAVVRRWLWLVILLPLLSVSVAVGVSLLEPSVYEASAKVVVTPTENTTPQKNFSNIISGLQMLAHEMEVAGLTPSMVEEVVRTPGGPSAVSASDLENNLTLEQDEDTRFLSLTYRDTKPSLAQWSQLCGRCPNQEEERKGSFIDGPKSKVLGALGSGRWRDRHANGRSLQSTTLL